MLFCLIIVVIFIRLGRVYRLGGDLEVIKWDASHKGMGPESWPLRTQCKGFNLAIAGRGMFTFHAIIPALYPFW